MDWSGALRSRMPDLSLSYNSCSCNSRCFMQKTVVALALRADSREKADSGDLGSYSPGSLSAKVTSQFSSAQCTSGGHAKDLCTAKQIEVSN